MSPPIRGHPQTEYVSLLWLLSLQLQPTRQGQRLIGGEIGKTSPGGKGLDPTFTFPFSQFFRKYNTRASPMSKQANAYHGLITTLHYGFR